MDISTPRHLDLVDMDTVDTAVDTVDTAVDMVDTAVDTVDTAVVIPTVTAPMLDMVDTAAMVMDLDMTVTVMVLDMVIKLRRCLMKRSKASSTRKEHVCFCLFLFVYRPSSSFDISWQ